MSQRMNTLIPERWDDKVYFYASALERDADGGWTIRVDPDACLVRDDRFAIDEVAALPTVTELRQANVRRIESGRGASRVTRWEGRILLSAGTVLFVDGRVLLLQRDAAPVDPFLWTSPAGRCDREPHLTAVKEFLEEVLVTESGTPVLVQLPGCEGHAATIEQIYADTCRRKGLAATDPQWIRLQAGAAPLEAWSGSPWTLHFGQGAGSETHAGRGFVFFDEACNTLEIRLVAELASTERRLTFVDGESYGRPVALFTPAQMAQLDLVAAMARVREVAWPDMKTGL